MEPPAPWVKRPSRTGPSSQRHQRLNPPARSLAGRIGGQIGAFHRRGSWTEAVAPLPHLPPQEIVGECTGALVRSTALDLARPFVGSKRTGRPTRSRYSIILMMHLIGRAAAWSTREAGCYGIRGPGNGIQCTGRPVPPPRGADSIKGQADCPLGPTTAAARRRGYRNGNPFYCLVQHLVALNASVLGPPKLSPGCHRVGGPGQRFLRSPT